MRDWIGTILTIVTAAVLTVSSIAAGRIMFWEAMVWLWVAVAWSITAGYWASEARNRRHR